jgi:hypothetical protein
VSCFCSIAAALLSRDVRLRRLAAAGAVGLAAGSLVSIVIALQGSFFGYEEPSLRFPIVRSPAAVAPAAS